MKKIFTLFLIYSTISTSTYSQLIAEWNFNLGTGTSTSIVAPSNGTGTMTAIGGTTVTYASGNTSGDPTQPGLAVNLSTFPTTTANNKTAGIEIAVNTTGIAGIALKFDLRLSNTAANTYTIQYSSNGGGTYTDFTTLVPPVNGGTIVFNNNNVYDFTTITALDNNPNVRFRIVATFANSGSAYVGNNGTYGTTGTARFDMVQIGSLGALNNKLESFTAFNINNNNTLTWKVGTETGIANYTIEKSTNGSNYNTLAVVAAQGTSIYNFTDNNVNGTTYYRLKINELNGLYTYSTIAKVKVDGKNLQINALYPSPAKELITVQLASKTNGIAQLDIVDLNGKIVLSSKVALTNGATQQSINIAALHSGTYFVRVHQNNTIAIEKFVKQ